MSKQDKVNWIFDNLDNILSVMTPRSVGHPTMDGRYPCWIVWLPKYGTVERKTLNGALLEYAEQAKDSPFCTRDFDKESSGQTSK